MAHCLDVLDCLREDYARLRACAVRLCADPCPTPVAVRAGLHELHRVFDTSSVAEEEVLLERALGPFPEALEAFRAERAPASDPEEVPA